MSGLTNLVKIVKVKTRKKEKLNINLNPRKVVSKKQIKEMTRQGVNPDFINAIQPQGGLTFADNYAAASDGYSACLSVIHYPNDPLILWLTQLSLNESTLTTIDVKTDSSYEIKQQLNRSIEELADRQENARKATDAINAQKDMQNLENYALQISQAGEIPKKIITRIFVYAPTIAKLEQSISNLRDKLRGEGYNASVYWFMQPKQYKSMAEPISIQETDLAAVPEQPVPALTLGAGNPFSSQSLKDPRGIWLGRTSTGGTFYFDQFRSTSVRRSFNMMILGKMGAGKSTLMKMLAEGSVARNMYFRGIDKTKEYIPLVKYYGGTIVNLDGSEGMINPLEIMATTVDETTNKVDELASFYQHISKVDILFQMVNKGTFASIEMKEFDSLLRGFYIDIGLIPRDFQHNKKNIHVTGLETGAYPTFSDFLNWINRLATEDYYKKQHFTDQRVRTYEKIKIALSSMLENYGQLFDGHSTMRDLTQTKMLLFDSSVISTMDPNVYQAQLYIALSLIWNHALINGRRQNALVKAGEISSDDKDYFDVFIDECHNIINYDNLFAVDYIKNFEREMRKFSAGVIFATQSPEEMVPDGVNDAKLSSLKVVFELCQYKGFMAMDPSQLKKVRSLMGGTLNEAEYNSIPEQQIGQIIFSMGGREKYQIDLKPSKRQLNLYEGGQ
ncbi:hypothetical protein SAMN04487792_1628 [Lactobacillus bombicola]|uniref:ATP-binding protein n=1 Tax=Lactobacillus bombicola TaxID=1505723 RepID=A0A1I1TUJ5_9LACO|nr:ATPase [Lactobacillus bombicola]SFD62262.1 hypothetical protein SAMN04487792_1628 [Lactobacillus bombicola]